MTEWLASAWSDWWVAHRIELVLSGIVAVPAVCLLVLVSIWGKKSSRNGCSQRDACSLRETVGDSDCARVGAERADETEGEGRKEKAGGVTWNLPKPCPFFIEEPVSGIINEDRLRELIDGRVKAMKQERTPFADGFVRGWFAGAVIGLIVASLMIAWSVSNIRIRLSRLESIVATDRTFAHGVAGGVITSPALADDAPAAPVNLGKRPVNDSEIDSKLTEPSLGPAVPIQPRAIPESELPKAKEWQPRKALPQEPIT